MDPVSFLILGGILAGAKRLWNMGGEDCFVDVTYERAFRIPMERSRAARTARDFLHGELGAELYLSEPTCQIYSRGDFGIKELPGQRKFSWLMVPVVIVVSLERITGGTRVNVRWAANDTLKLTKSAAEFFHQSARREFDVLVERFEAGCASPPPPEEPASTPPPPPDNANDDYAVLGLSTGARWSDIQTAYREACRRFHPDALSGAGIPQHLVDLAAEQFKRITAAYEALRRRERR